jgi:S-DNA-T family DNA segregation ATPase FtsK/SpoIIIE
LESLEAEDSSSEAGLPTSSENASEEEEIIFHDHTAPLNTEKPKARVGQELARLFPTRWPKEGTPVGAESDSSEEGQGAMPLQESAEEVLDKSEERRLRQLRDAQAALKINTGTLEGEHTDPASDPLFTAAFDTRPHGPNGEPLDIIAEQPDFVDQLAKIYQLPDLNMLADPPVVDTTMTREEVIEMSQKLTQTIADYGIEGKVTQVHQGPVVTLFEFRPAAGTKVSRIVGLEQDIAMGMKALSVRILAPIPGKNVVGIEVPNKVRQGVYLKELISCDDFWDAPGTLEVAIGKTIDGKPFFADLAKMPHLLIAGATGAGKSVCLNTIICSLLYRQNPEKVKLIMVDPKRVELSVYRDIPHLLAPVVCEAKRAAAALEWAVEQMENRYKLLVEFGVRNIDGYNALCDDPGKSKKSVGRSLKPMPFMVVIVDELADLMIVAKADVEESIQRLAQMARAVGIHLILATQRPSVNVITGIIKANFPSRIAFQVSQKVDSRTILDSNGAEALLGRGDMLFSKGGAAKPIRIQGAFLSDDEVEAIAEHCRQQQPVRYEVEEFEPKLSEKEQRELAKMMGVENFGDLDAQDRIVNGTNKVMGKVTAGMFIPHEGGSASAGDDEIDEALVRAAARLILESRKASVSLLQRRLKVGFARAGRLMDMLEEMKIVGEYQGSKPREIIVDPEAALEELDKLEASLAREGKLSASSREVIEEADEEGYGDPEER